MMLYDHDAIAYVAQLEFDFPTEVFRLQACLERFIQVFSQTFPNPTHFSKN